MPVIGENEPQGYTKVSMYTSGPVVFRSRLMRDDVVEK